VSIRVLAALQAWRDSLIITTMKVAGAALVCVITLYVVDMLYCDGQYFSTLREVFIAAINRY